ncbi:MAG: ComEC/Rec2 family competence protein [Oscillospiraceae bacterium]|nr:ComEC/Rec2 family competence protein [Oscillospiraceae bacterium]MDD4367896.1 ComEC/Rec2 family competence protein [Oscillospiraceae bacterium]
MARLTKVNSNGKKRPSCLGKILIALAVVISIGAYSEAVSGHKSELSSITTTASVQLAAAADTESEPGTSVATTQASATLAPTTQTTALAPTTATAPLTEAITLTEAIEETAPETILNKARSYNNPLYVHFLDVGQGAAVLLSNADDTLLFDGGGGSASSYTVSYLRNQSLIELEYMVSSHYDEDHLGGLVGVLNVFPITGTVFDGGYAADTRVYSSFKSYISSHDIAETVPYQGEELDLGAALITFLAPENYNHSEDNDNSIGLRVDYGESSYILMGDQSAEAEADLISSGLNLDADVLYAAHHGSKTSTSASFLDAVTPDWVVISCGEDNSYGHPTQETLTRIQAAGAQLFRTDVQGAIVSTSDGSTISWDQDPCNNFTPGSNETATPTPEPTIAQETEAPTALVEDEAPGQTYVLNTNSHKFHYPDCPSVDRMSDKNKKIVTDTRDHIIAEGYDPCKNCNP